VKTSDFDYALPPELIAQTPLEPRDKSRLMILSRSDGSIEHRLFSDIVDYLRAGDVLVFNDSKVIPARLHARKVDTGGRLEILLLRRLRPGVWETLVRPGKRVKTGDHVEVKKDSVTEDGQGLEVMAEVVASSDGGIRVMSFSDETWLDKLGEIPLPPYIRVPLTDSERYQTVYANVAGSIAAPTAGLHFTTELIDKIENRGVQCLFVTLQVGLDTFRPIQEEDPSEHPIHQEYGVITRKAADQLSEARAEGRRIISVGTTAVRLVEAAAQAGGLARISPFEGWVSLYILPGYQFQTVDGFITNFHLPRSTLLMMVSAFAGRQYIQQAYREAIAQKYRFYSFGDAMLIL
jgi:S-adenosylmethionine:tRNA ribosyltransferase-isomerase